MNWYDKRYHTANYYFREKYNDKVIKITLDGGFTCPNRDGSKSFGGCIFCSETGSGDFTTTGTIHEQFYSQQQIMQKKWKQGKYIAYFQNFTNTYKDIQSLYKLYNEVLTLDIVAISIATRPDCIDDDTIELFKHISSRVDLIVELGLQTSNDTTASLINRQYETVIYADTMQKLQSLNIHVITHIIFGLPYETFDDMLNTVKYAVDKGTNGIKLQLLHIIKDTKMHNMYKQHNLTTLTFNEYIDLIVESICIIPQDVVIHRLTGDGNHTTLIAPLYSTNKKAILNTIDKQLRDNNLHQGIFYSKN